MIPDFWTRCCERLAAEIPEQQFNTWMRPLSEPVLSERSPNRLVARLAVPNRFKLDWIRAQYGVRLQAIMSEVADREVGLELSLASGAATSTPSSRRGLGPAGSTLPSEAVPSLGEAGGGARPEPEAQARASGGASAAFASGATAPAGCIARSTTRSSRISHGQRFSVTKSSGKTWYHGSGNGCRTVSVS